MIAWWLNAEVNVLPLVPAEAGIQFLALDSRLRGNERRMPEGRWIVLYLISPANLGSVRLISGMQIMSSKPMNSASM